MRILYVIPYFAPAWGYGGPPKVIYDISRKLVERGHDITVYSTDALDANSRVEKRYDVINGVKVQYFRNLSNWLCWNQKIFLPLGFWGSIRGSIGNFDLLHLSDFRTCQNAVAYGCALKNDIPYVVSAFGQLPRATGVKRPIKRVYDLLFGYEMLRQASRVLAQTEDEALEYERFGVQSERVALIPLGIDLSEFESLPPRGLFRRQFSIPDEAPLVLFLGRLHAYKGLDLLVRAFRQVASQLPEARLAIVGRDDGYLSTLQALITELDLDGQVVFTGPLYGRDRIPAYVDADVFALTPSHAEQTSLAALEACATGTPVVVTRQATIPGLTECQGGLVVEYDEDELKSALLMLLTDRKLRAESGQNARKMIEESFDWEVVTGCLEEIYGEIVESQESA